MTLQQLRYVVMVADTGTITEAANRLYISQPSLTNAIHELEKEMGINIFNRSNKGISPSIEGEVFLGYARQVLEQAKVLEDKYKGDMFKHCERRYGQDNFHFTRLDIAIDDKNEIGRAHV